MRLGTILKLAVLAGMILVVALVAVVKSINVERYRSVLAQSVKAATGRDLVVRGKITLKLSVTPSLIADDVVFANMPGGSRPEMLTVQRLTADIGLFALLHREVRITRLVLIAPDLLLERDAKGRANWQFDQSRLEQAPNAGAASGTPTTFHIGQIRIEGGHLAYRDVTGAAAQTLDIQLLTIDADNVGMPFGVAMKGRWNNEHPVEVSGLLGPALSFGVPGKPYPIKLKAVLPGLVTQLDGNLTEDVKSGPLLALKLSADAGDVSEAARLVGLTMPALGAGKLSLMLSGPIATPQLLDIDAAIGRKGAAAMTMRGSVKHPLEGRGVDLLMTAEGENLAGFNKPLGLALPELGPLRIAGRLSDIDGGWRLGEMKGSLSKSDLTGDVILRLPHGRPTVEAHLASAVVNVDELQGPHAEPGKSKPAEERYFSAEPLPLAALGLGDADITWKIDSLTDDQLRARQVELTLALNGGKLTLASSAATLAGATGATGATGGKLSGSLSVDTAVKPAAVAVAVNGAGIALGDLLKGLDVTSAVHDARADLHIGLAGTGDSTRAVMAKLNGDVVVIADKGEFDGGAANGVALDVLQQLAPTGAGTQMRCMVSRFVVNNGMAKSEVLLLDTDRATITGQGSINLADETLDLTMLPRLKEGGGLSMAVPMDVGGTLLQPMVSSDKGAIVKGAPLGVVVPPNAAVTDANPCVVALVQANKKPLPARGKLSKKAKLAVAEIKDVTDYKDGIGLIQRLSGN
ncbi:MAG TPA: AsmA family protein [Patescibacteria group bacterium]|nr:AsmA family protein [Patescibacteria group bacterium]